MLHQHREIVQKCQLLVAEWLAQMGLELKPSKTRFSDSGHRHKIQANNGLKQDVTSNEARPCLVFVLSSAPFNHSLSCCRRVFSFFPNSSAKNTETVVNPLD
ncbi:hypothetical protein [Tolypothrix sp. VBCCA 56010]|uniref:hypothetical protein n=1 Tax=Tolypothrix sp. VBCCA 56010 TaxID=3137731 RepID=UPI003D7C55AC